MEEAGHELEVVSGSTHRDRDGFDPPVLGGLPGDSDLKRLFYGERVLLSNYAPVTVACHAHGAGGASSSDHVRVELELKEEF
jgi:hypothetical protein